MPLRHSAIGLATAALAGLLALGACGAAGPVPGSASSAAGASSAAPAPSSAPAASAPAAGATVPVDTIAAKLTKATTSFKTASIETNVQTPQGGTKATGAIDQSDPKNVKLRLSMTLAGRQLEVIVVDGVTYTTSPTAAGKYLKVTSGADQLSPLQQIDKLKSSLKSARYIGSETLAGAKADHYQYTVEASGTAITVDTWFDASDRPLQFKTGVGTGSEVVATYGNFDAAVDIKAPAADQVVG